LVNRNAMRSDIKAVAIPASEIAEQIGDRRLTNMVLLGGLLANLPVLSLENLQAAIRVHTPARHQKLMPLNLLALEQGATFLAQTAK
jgi:2-oxoglutarate ferredoxin oxidoreductase subunit gamma